MIVYYVKKLLPTSPRGEEIITKILSKLSKGSEKNHFFYGDPFQPNSKIVPHTNAQLISHITAACLAIVKDLDNAVSAVGEDDESEEELADRAKAIIDLYFSARLGGSNFTNSDYNTLLANVYLYHSAVHDRDDDLTATTNACRALTKLLEVLYNEKFEYVIPHISVSRKIPETFVVIYSKIYEPFWEQISLLAHDLGIVVLVSITENGFDRPYAYLDYFMPVAFEDDIAIIKGLMKKPELSDNAYDYQIID